MFIECGWNTTWPLKLRQVARRLLFGGLNASFHISNRVQIFSKLCPVARSNSFHHSRGRFTDGIQQTTILPNASNSFCTIRAVAIPEQTFEDSTRTIFARKRCRGAAPRECMKVTAA